MNNIPKLLRQYSPYLLIDSYILEVGEIKERLINIQEYLLIFWYLLTSFFFLRFMTENDSIYLENH